SRQDLAPPENREAPANRGLRAKSSRGATTQRSLGGAHLSGARPLRAGLDFELDALAAGKPVEVERGGELVAVEEVLLAVFGGDEAEAAVGDNLLDCSCGHGDPFLFPNQTQTHGLFEKERSTTRESPRQCGDPRSI